jgi:hypothetical protein
VSPQEMSAAQQSKPETATLLKYGHKLFTKGFVIEEGYIVEEFCVILLLMRFIFVVLLLQNIKTSKIKTTKPEKTER